MQTQDRFAQMPGGWRGTELDLVRAAQSGDENAATQLIRRYRSLVRCKARSYFLAGGDRDDVIQEGLIGLCKAIRDYDPSRKASFRSFAELCVTRQMITAIKTATRCKHAPLNTYVSLNCPNVTDDEGERLLTDILAAKEICDPADIVLSAWEGDSVRQGLCDSLSTLEARVLRLYVDGCSYQEIAKRLGRHTKSVDNALQRVKRKIETQIDRCRVC